MMAQWPDLPADGQDNAAEAAQAALSRMSAMLAVASGLVSSGRRVDLAGLEQTAGRLCARVLDLQPDQALALRPGLVALHDRVAALMDAMQESAS